MSEIAVAIAMVSLVAAVIGLSYALVSVVTSLRQLAMDTTSKLTHLTEGGYLQKLTHQSSAARSVRMAAEDLPPQSPPEDVPADMKPRRGGWEPAPPDALRRN